MDYKSILVHLDAGKTLPARLALAFDLGQTFDSRVACLYALTAAPMPSAAAEAGQTLIDAQAKVSTENRNGARRAYEESLRRSGFTNAEWRETSDDALAAVALHARYSDLVVIGQKNEEWASGVGPAFQEQILLAAGRPVLVVPYVFEGKPVGIRIVVAWNASREAARAVSDALPLLKRARQVEVVSFNPKSGPDGHGEVPGADVGQYLAHHGVKVAVSSHRTKGIDAGNLLLSRAFDLSADLIVMGAWGHSRVREIVLGGVTRTILQSMTVPVLMAH